MLQNTLVLFLLCSLLRIHDAQGKVFTVKQVSVHPGVLWKRQIVSHGQDERHEDDHNHDECSIDGDTFSQVFNQLAQELSMTGQNGELCSHNSSHNLQENVNCSGLYTFASELVLKLNITDECCLVNGTTCHHGHHHHDDRASTAEVYGYGFLMILLVSACSLLGVLILPLVRKNSKFGQFYKYLYSLMIAMGASALFCDAILHLIPEAFSLHSHDHSEEEEEDRSFIWKGCVVIAGTYFFFLFETILHIWNPHNHSHGADTVVFKGNKERAKNHASKDRSSTHSEEALLSENPAATTYGSTTTTANTGNVRKDTCSDDCLEPTVPHGKCRDGEEETSGILHPGLPDSAEESTSVAVIPARMNCFARTWHFLLNIKPLAWLIIFGDAIHNFADGLALGAAIAQSLSLGISTMIALVFHEIPHELGDFVILLSTGMRWYTALCLNLVSQITGIIAFFVGVAISTSSEEANGWILAVAAGVFLYIALVDLLPGLIHTKDTGSSRWGQFLMSNLGFLVAFLALLLLAVFEEDLNELIAL